ncbi:MFS transporter [Lactobacillus sp.] [Lactiplantibacillus mudanjiangensis]|uniref:MFS transporter [Lactobacillus sp.] n=2 Tax=Lactiplantibacillus mudanjiangensis TaxID=1296538 RepID=A0A660E1K0_9LACO|nr:MFS transporter [Lactobacillus sp.] [Lactiplantibacillus mudanjiangensis]VDG22808.1 MFS transporter [Lactobacillus sp.] [Lactiplantibacillus mudanjiangensis]VDG26620.1 MFS transporter [Lactobacillus sp.] [Lactiplantibacillus mudanjiangensis]VDG31854.1 MFS transporter [Lactobacillus sp.] [Lactiplantibacillus mudanjiangensis]
MMTKTHAHSRYLTLGMILVAANMRLPITMMPGLISSLKHTLGLPSSMAGLLTTIPLLTFAVMSPLIAYWGRRFGNEWTIYGLLVILAIGSYLRLLPAIGLLLFGTLLVGIGVDGGNVLIPAIIKDNFPTKIGIATSEYTVSMLLVGAIGTGVSGVLAAHWSLPIVMAVLSVLSVINLIVWVPNLAYNHREGQPVHQDKTTENTVNVWHLPVAWLVTAFFGLQALVYYSMLTWLPTILVAHGFTAIAAGNLVTVMQLGGLPLAFLVPITAEKRYGVPVMVATVGIGFIGGIAGILLPGLSLGVATFLCLILGFGSGAAFNLAVVFFTQKTNNGFDTAALSGMAQSAGYLLAAVGPVLFGWLGSHLGWTLVICLAVILSVLLTLTGVIINRHDSIYE